MLKKYWVIFVIILLVFATVSATVLTPHLEVKPLLVYNKCILSKDAFPEKVVSTSLLLYIRNYYFLPIKILRISLDPPPPNEILVKELIFNSTLDPSEETSVFIKYTFLNYARWNIRKITVDIICMNIIFRKSLYVNIVIEAVPREQNTKY